MTPRGKKAITFSMAIRNAKLLHDCFQRNLRIGTGEKCEKREKNLRREECMNMKRNTAGARPDGLTVARAYRLFGVATP